MRPFGSLNSIDQIPLIPDTVGSVVISSAGAVVAQDWPAGAQMVYFSGPSEFYVNYSSTQVAIPSASTAGSTAAESANVRNPGIRQMSTSLSTGYSITAPTSGPISAEFWRK